MSFIENLETFGSQAALQNENGDIVSYQNLALRADSLSEEIGDNKKFIFVKCDNNIDTDKLFINVDFPPALGPVIIILLGEL